MGCELIAKVTDCFARRQRRCVDEIEQMGLFSGFSQLSVALVATPNHSQSFEIGQACRLSLNDDQLVIIQGVSIIGYVEDPPRSVMDLLNGSCPSANGKVVSLFQLSGKAQIQLE